jgi:hypothetical protein
MKRLIYSILAIFLLWIISDVFYPKKVNLANFDPKETARLDCEMWRSYYEKKPLKLFLQMAELLRTQMKAPFWRSNFMAFHASKAAFIFKNGKNRFDYIKALPELEKYYYQINLLSVKPFDVKLASQNELEWWIIRRENKIHKHSEWADFQAKVASEIYQKPPLLFHEYGRIRSEAMLYRDLKGENISEIDWLNIRSMLENAWTTLKKVAE